MKKLTNRLHKLSPLKLGKTLVLFIFLWPIALLAEPSIPPVLMSSELVSEEGSWESLNEDIFLDEEIQENRSLKAFWKTVFETKILSDKATMNAIVSNEIYGKLDLKMTEFLSFHTKGLIIGRNGFTQSIYDRDDRQRGLYLLEGFFKWHSESPFAIQAGSIQQNFLKAPLLTSDKSFPSLLGEFSFEFYPPYSLSFLLQTAIPENASEIVRREPEVLKSPPWFFSSSAFFVEPDFLFDLGIEERLTLFYYHNLSPAVADRSRIYGNSIERTASSSTFKYPFLGLHNHIQIKKSLSTFWIVEVGGIWLYNFLAPNTHNEGMRLYSTVYHNYDDIMEIKLKGEFFANQSDSSVAYYSSETYGRNNQRGFLAEAQNHFYDSGLTVGLRFVYSQPINYPDKSPKGSSFSFSFSLMTNYIPI